MSTTIDTNVVQLKFDNKQFEENCKQSMSTLEKLKQKINESNSGKALDGLNKVDLSNIKDSIDSVNKHFSLLGIAALKVKSSIVDGFLGMAKTLATTVPRIIKEGGWQRAMNIEEAKFQLEGLHVAWSQISDDISYAVDGTAYGLDAAAKAASQLVASGVQVGDSMKGALRAISGVAAMTNAEYEAIAPIFTTVAGQGKLMTMQLRQLENRGLNAAAVLAQSMHTTEATIREMVKNGEIDFNTFAQAMDNAFGEHAKDANRTFVGVTANIRAALKKIGADFATPIIEQDGPVIKALQVLRERINDVRKSLGPLNDAWTAFVYNYGRVAEKLLKSIDMSFMENVTRGLVNTFNTLLSIVRPIGYAIRDIFGANANSSLKSFAETFESFTAKLILSREEMEDLRATVRGVLSIFTIFTTVIKQILGAILQVKPETVDIGAIILKITGSIGDMITFISLVIKQINIIGPAISGISTAIKMLIGLLATGAIKVTEFITKLSQLKVTSKIIDGVTIAVKALLAGIILLASTIKDFVTNNIAKIPQAIAAIKNELQFVFDLLSGIPIIQKAADYVMNLAKSFDKLLHPNKGDAKELENVITIADEAVALAGPQQVSTLEKFIDTIKTVISKITEMSGSIVQFIKNLDYGAIAAVTFTLAIAGIGYKLAQTFQSVTDSFNATANAIRQIGGFIGSFQNRSIMEFIFGKQEPPPQHKLLEFAAAMIAVAGSVKLMTTIDAAKLKEVGIWLGTFGAGLAVLATVFTILQKRLGEGETLAITNALFAIAGSIALMVASLDLATKLDFTNIQKAGFAITQLSVVLGGMAIALAKLAPALSTSSIALVAMAYSLKIMVGVLKSINNLHINSSLFTKSGRNLWGKAGLLMTVAGGLVIISGIASKLGTNSLIGILIALGSLKLIIPLANTVATQIQTSIFADVWHKLVDFFVNIKSEHPKLMAGIAAFVAIGAAIAGIIGAVYLIKKAFIAIKNLSSTITQTNEKFAGLQKALARLSLVPVIISLTGFAVAIGVMVGVLGKIKLPYIDQAIKILAAIGLMFVSLAVVVTASKDAKPGAIIGAMVGLSMMFSELIILTLLVERHWKSMITACGVMATLMLSLSAVFYNISKASELSTKTLIAIGMVGGIIAELGGILYILSQQDWASVAASGAAMSAAMLSFAKMLETIGATGQSWTKNKFIAMAEAAGVVAVIGASLTLATLTHDWAAMLAAGASMSAVMVTFGVMMQIVGKTQWNAGAWSAVAAIAVLAVSIGAALAIATLNHDWAAMLAAAGAMSAVMAVFGGMATIMGNTANLLSSFVMMVSVAGTAVAIAASLAMLAQYPWQDILIAAGIMAGTMAVLSALAIGLGAIAPLAIPGAIALDLIAVAMLGLSTSASILLGALTAFLPIANAFLDNVLGTIVGFAPQLPSAALGLTEIAGGLSLVGAAGLILTAGSIGLLTTAAGLTALLPAVSLLNQIDFVKIGSGLQSIAQSGSLLIPVGVGLLAATPGFTLASGALTVFAGAIVLVAKALNDKTIKEMEKIPKKMVEIGQWIPKSLANGMNGQANTAINAAKDLASKIESTIRNKLDIHSESPLLKSIGGWIPKSVGNGIKIYINGALGPVGLLGTSIISSLDGTAKEAGNSGTKITNNLGNALNSGLDWIERTTGIKLSKIENQFKQMDIYRTALGGDFDFMSDPSLPDDVKRQMQEQKIKELENLANATGNATAAQEDFAKAAKGSGKAAKEEKEEIKDLTDAFKNVEKGSKVSLETMANNLKANVKAHYEWVKDVKDVANMGYDKAIVDWIKKNKEAGHETVKALKSATAEEAASLNKNLAVWLNMDEETERILSDDFAEDGAAIAQSYINSMGSTFDSNLAETLQKALDPFGEFDKKAEKGAAKLLENMKSQVEGFQTWGGMINDLQHRNLNQNALEYLIGLGTSGYEDVTAIFQMTDDQINEFNQLWAQQENLGKEIAGGIQHEMNLIAAAVNEGFPAGIDPTVAYDALQNFAQEGLAGAKSKDGFDVNSPSKKMIAIGKNVTDGLGKGVKSYGRLAYTEIIAMAKHCIDVADDTINYDSGLTMGEDLMRGLESGINRGSGSVFSAIESVCSSLISKANAVLDRHSPSREFMAMGRDVDRGLALGIDRNTDSVTSSIYNLGNNTIQMMNDIIRNITDDMNSSPELQPVIRPRLDLTAIQNGKSLIGGMFGSGYTTQLATSIGPYSDPVSTSINNLDFTPASNADVVSAIGRLRNDVNAMTEQITNMQVVLDGRTVVGELAPAMDTALGTNAIRAGRGN